MAKKQQQKKELTEEELEAQEGEPLPERTQMSVIGTDPLSYAWNPDEIMPAPGPAPVDS